MTDRRDGSADTTEEALLRRWYAASSRAERLPTTELLSGAGRNSRRHPAIRNLAVGAVVIVAVVAATVFTGTWAGLRSSGATPTPSIGMTPTASPVPQATGHGGPSLATGEQVVQMHRTGTGGWLLTPARLLITDGSSWRDCWLSGEGFGGSMPGMQAFFVGNAIHVQLSATLWTSTDGCVSWSQASIPVDPIDLAFPTPDVGYAIGGNQTLEANPTTTIFKTVDGGLHWKATGTARVSTAAAIPLISFADADHGWVADGVSVWTTANGGVSWVKTALPRPPSVKGTLSGIAKSVDGSGAGVIAALYDTTSGMGGVPLQLVFYATSDFGKHWKAATVLEVQESTEFTMVDTETWVTLDPSEPATVRTTTNAGSTWQTLTGGRRWPFSAAGIDFADALHGWLVVTEPPASSQSPVIRFGPSPPRTQHLVVTDDGGATWVELNP